ncbi:MAG TPA: ABC transporter ATP-binding protein [Polyangiaceae bacterium]|jgi:ABC-type Fe3+/spermidine/putrescine transport system ATPase subunit|nr:ABC transporter ATP-binding protein [Polyangiaceae bacterium]
MDAADETVLSLRRLRKTYGSVIAVDDLSFDVERGEVVCVLGPSGCGKTTTLRMVAGFVAPTAGDIRIKGTSVGPLPPYRRDTGMVFQNYALFPHLSVAENVGFAMRNLGVPRAEREARVREMLGLVELDEMGGRLPRELSGGQQQRVALARALAFRPSVLLLDEPLSNLDAQLRIRMREEIRELVKRLQSTTLFVTHDQEEALSLADRIVVMHRGRVEQIGSPADVYERPQSRFVAQFIGLCNLLEGVADGRDGGLVVQSARGLRVQAAAGTASPGERVVVAVRPEHICLATGGEVTNRWRARVMATTYLGSVRRHRLALGGEELLMEVRTGEASPLAPGDEADIAVDPTHVRLLRA